MWQARQGEVHLAHLLEAQPPVPGSTSRCMVGYAILLLVTIKTPTGKKARTYIHETLQHYAIVYFDKWHDYKTGTAIGYDVPCGGLLRSQKDTKQVLKYLLVFQVFFSEIFVEYSRFC